MLGDAGCFSIPFGVAPHRLSGAVYGALLNHRSALDALGGSVNLPPYQAPPRSPVLHIKPRNTLGRSGDAVTVPAGTAELEVGAGVGMVIGRTACRVDESRALDYVAGYLIVADVSIPHSDHYRPSIRLKARDGYCPLGPAVVARAAVENPGALVVRTHIDGVLVQSASTAELVRSAAQLLAEVTDFMTLSPGDVLALGAAAPAPRAKPGQTMIVSVEELGSLVIPFTGAAA
jgi:5-oxopent-3-ene-1,2,5-tricarboxylate decarboxylase / 2-hydroxyhepta-2,4-diene-1,7-dioate isomerase